MRKPDEVTYDLFVECGISINNHGKEYFNTYILPEHPNAVYVTIHVYDYYVFIRYIEEKSKKLIRVDKEDFLNFKL